MQEGAVVISRTGTAAATVQGSNISVHGTVAGDLLASGKIEVTETAKVSGTITAPSLVLLAGAVVNGKVEVKGARKEAERPNLRIVETEEIAS
jgi:cytoskeletal protein CcmA (bactofilin family)